MYTLRTTFRSNLLRPLLAIIAVALMAASVSTHADTLYTLQVQAITDAEGAAADILFSYPLTYSSAPLAASAHYEPAVGAIGCCSGSYAASGSATSAHGGTAMASATGNGVFVGSTLPQDPLGHPQPLGRVTAYAVVDSRFQLVGPASATPIWVDLYYQISASSTGSGLAWADLIIYGGCASCTAPVIHQTTYDETYAGGTTIQLLPNEPYTMIATAQAWDSTTNYNAPSNSGSGFALVDPLFSLPPGSGAYQFVGLPSAPVPEPPVMILLAAGLAVVGFRSRATRRA